jgi:hypothetical protein
MAKWKRLKQLSNLIFIGKELGNKTNITFISIKPSISRWHLESKIIQANTLIAQLIWEFGKKSCFLHH